jgi:hypothetical protein
MLTTIASSYLQCLGLRIIPLAADDRFMAGFLFPAARPSATQEQLHWQEELLRVGNRVAQRGWKPAFPHLGYTNQAHAGEKKRHHQRKKSSLGTWQANASTGVGERGLEMIVARSAHTSKRRCANGL